MCVFVLDAGRSEIFVVDSDQNVRTSEREGTLKSISEAEKVPLLNINFRKGSAAVLFHPS